METVSQPSNNPTNKVTAQTLAVSASGFLFVFSGLVVRNVAPSWYDPEVWASAQALLTVFVGFAAGYIAKDKPNVVVQVSQ